MKRRIILFLLNRFGRKKEQSGSGGKAAVGIGCLSAFFMGPFLAIFLFFAVIVWIATSLFACTAQAFYLLYMDRVTARVSYLSDLAYCFSDGVKLRTIVPKILNGLGLVETEEGLDATDGALDKELKQRALTEQKGNEM